MSTIEEQKQPQKSLQEFGAMPKQNMLLDLNPILMNNPDRKKNEERLYKLRNFMEDPANQLKLDHDLRITTDNQAYIQNLQTQICDSIIAEDHAIKMEIKYLDDNKVT